MIKKLLLRALAVLIIVLLTQYAVIGISPDDNPLRPPATDSPRDTLSAFMTNMNEAYQLIKEAEEQTKKERGLWHSQAVQKKGDRAILSMRRAINALNLVDVPPIFLQDFGTESALMLKEVLDRLELPQVNDIPGQEDVVSKSLTHWEIPGSEIAIELVEEGFNVNEFLFSPETVKRIKTFYELTKQLEPNKLNSWKNSPGFYKFYITTPGQLLPPKWSRWLPKWTTRLFYDQAIWQWFSLGTITFILIGSIFGIKFLLKRYIHITNPQKQGWLGLFLPAFTLSISKCWELIMNHSINITGQLLDNLLKVSTVVEGGVLAWLAFMIFNAIGSTIISNMAEKNNSLEVVITRNGVRLLGFMAALVIFYTTSQEIGVAIGPIIASLGVGSIAIGFGVKPYIENIVGGLTLFLSRPMQIGDFCELGGVIGIVEDIALRSTLIRTPDRKLIYVPNTVVSTNQIVNHTRRDKYVFERIISLSYEGANEKLGETMENLRIMLAKNPKLSEENISLGSLSNEVIEIKIFSYILTTDFDEFIIIKEEILQEIYKIISLMETTVFALSGSKEEG